ncbi:MAG: aldehyde dehydrogenase family protein [Planctomycetota bacterium]|nr:aldehyde dehydrogenase family protein [Planctomycetota bacterium]
MNTSQQLNRVNHWIGGAEVVPKGTIYFESRNPVDDFPICLAAKGTPAVIDAAVEAAHGAFECQQTFSPSQKEKWILSAAELLEEQQDDFVEILIQEIGSPVSKARKEISTSIAILRASAGATRQISGKTYPTDVPGRLSLSMRTPLGVVAGIIPFNVPLIKAIKHSSMPLATGNTVVLLSSEETPLLLRRVARLYDEAGVPGGAFNVVFGDGRDIGDCLTTHPKVRAVGFTGSHRVGQQVRALCGQHGKRVTLELGGKNPLVVLRDADLQKAVAGCVVGSFLYQGQICMSSSCIFVEHSIRQKFQKAFVTAASQVKWGDLHDPRTMVGPIINAKQQAKIKHHLQDAIEKGATVLTGNQWHGNLLEPTILAEVDSSMLIDHEETFGPVTTLYGVASAEEAISKANDSEFGLCGSIYTNQLDQAVNYANQLKTGMVHINDTTIQDEPHVPFGGVGQSGFGREGTEVSIDELTEWKWITIRSG